MGEQQFVELILGPGGLLVALIFALIGGFRGWWVFGRVFRDMQEERDEWRRLALQSTNLAEKSAELGSRLISSGGR